MTTPDDRRVPPQHERAGELPDVVAAARHAEDLGFESVWVVDQLVAGTGVPFLDSTVALAAAAAATSRIRLGYGVLILPLRPVAWAAKQAASLQHLSGDRLLLGVGVGGDRHDRSWAAAGVPRRSGGAASTPPSTCCPTSSPARRSRSTAPRSSSRRAPPSHRSSWAAWPTPRCAVRAAAHGDGWFTLPLPPARLRPAVARLQELPAQAVATTPAVTASTDRRHRRGPRPSRPRHARPATRPIPTGMLGMPAEAVPEVLVTSGGPGQRWPTASPRSARARRRAGGGDPRRRRLVPPGRAAGRCREAAPDLSTRPPPTLLTRVRSGGAEWRSRGWRTWR